MERHGEDGVAVVVLGEGVWVGAVVVAMMVTSAMRWRVGKVVVAVMVAVVVVVVVVVVDVVVVVSVIVEARVLVLVVVAKRRVRGKEAHGAEEGLGEDVGAECEQVGLRCRHRRGEWGRVRFHLVQQQQQQRQQHCPQRHHRRGGWGRVRCHLVQQQQQQQQQQRQRQQQQQHFLQH